MPRKKKGVGMGDYLPTEQEQKAYRYGIRNDIRIAPRAVPNSAGSWYVEIFQGGRWSHNGEQFGPVDVWRQVYAYYIYYYNKRNK